MTDPVVAVLRNKYVRGWPRHGRGERVQACPLSRALARSYTTDAHFASYATPNGRRLTRGALDQLGPIALTCIAFDVDCAAVHGSSEPAPEWWRAELSNKVSELAALHPDPFVYMTRGGARIVYMQVEPTLLRTHIDAQQWSQDYAVAIAYLARRFGIAADPACADWQRLYRLPHATRDASGVPESWATIGDASRIGALTIDATVADVDTAQRASKAFLSRRVLEFVPCIDEGDGVLYRMLEARGDIIRAHGSGAFMVRCPNEREHSTGRTGDGSTVLYLPARGEHVGAIHCMHAHCAGMSVRDWVRAFSPSERDAVRIARFA